METKHNCPHCKKELTLENGIWECQGSKHYYRTTPKELKVSQEFYNNFWKRTLFCDDFKSESIKIDFTIIEGGDIIAKEALPNIKASEEY